MQVKGEFFEREQERSMNVACIAWAQRRQKVASNDCLCVSENVNRFSKNVDVFYAPI